MKKCTIFLKSLLVICLVCMSIGCTMVSASDLGLANSKIVELGSFGSNGENISSSNRARTKNIYKTSEQAFKFESSKATRINVSGIFSSSILVKDASNMNANTTPLAPRSWTCGKNMKLITPVTSAVAKITKRIFAEPYFSSKSGPTTSNIIIFPKK